MTVATCSASSLSAGCTLASSGFTSCRLARPAMYEPIAPREWSGIAERLADRLEPLARLLQRRERDERAQDLVGPLEDQVDA